MFYVFLLSIDNNIFLYGVFDGHSGCKVSAYAAQNLPADILLDQLKGKTTDKEIKEVLYQVPMDFLMVFDRIESAFLNHIFSNIFQLIS